MKAHIKSFLLLSSVFLSNQTLAEQEQLAPATIEYLAEMFSIKTGVLSDFVQSYDFKCPQALSNQDLISILSLDEEETQLSVMQESDKLGWRDTYLEARSRIACLTGEAVTSAY
ncbi:hypothetical protein [Oceaniserpentilla sp. 4NH20-0058]|uniref:hypothetical protein n=1 Tax=Oceaniserpentilla sp. 4NH20-0058 TaxID=3127660 RepID=UPI00333F5E4F